MFDLKVINSVIDQMGEERGITREKMLDAIAQSLATAYKKEYGKRGQIIRAHFDIATGTTEFEQVKIVVDETMVRLDDPIVEEVERPEDRGDRRREKEEELVIPQVAEGEARVRFDPEKHILIEDARFIKKGVVLGEELIFPLEQKEDFGRIAAQTAKQVIIQKIREAEKEAALAEFGQKAGDIVMGHVQRFERGNLYVDLGRVTGVMPFDEQVQGERYRTGERIRALLVAVEETPRGIFIKLSRSHPDFLEKLFAVEAPELQSGAVVVKAIAREAGSRSKIAVASTDPHIDPVGSLVGQRGVRVSTVMSELGGEKIDIIEWSENLKNFIEDALSPARVASVELLEQEGETVHTAAKVTVAQDQQSLAIGRGGQNVRLAAKLTGAKIDIVSSGAPLETATETASDNVAEETVEKEVAEEKSDEAAA
ncbi:MAG: transcription elongation factor NusA, utilization substance protein [Candidatus Parcubacteria bacterium]|jgi:N utilization substance protein A